jgi:hypothetical protein
VLKERDRVSASSDPPGGDHWTTYTSAGDAVLRVGKFGETEGMWLFRKGEAPQLIATGTFSGAQVSPDGKWCVAAKAAEGRYWDEPNGVVRVNLSTHQMIPVPLKNADSFYVVTYLSTKGGFLLRRQRDSFPTSGKPPVGPERAEYHLLDAASGALERIKGDFEGLEKQRFRLLQPAAKPGCVWMARYWSKDVSQIGTIVGIYDMNTFKFQEIRKLDHLAFDSMEMWVDEDAGCFYAVVNGDLVRVRLR